jgi:hypothetical protein
VNALGFAIVGGAIAGGIYFATRKEAVRTEWSKKVAPEIVTQLGLAPTASFGDAVRAQLAELGDEPTEGALARACAFWWRHLGTGDVEPIDVFDVPSHANQMVLKEEAPEVFAAAGTFYSATSHLFYEALWPASEENLEGARRALRELAATLDGNTTTRDPVAPVGTLEATFDGIGRGAAAIGNGLARVASEVAKTTTGIVAAIGKGFAEGAGVELIIIAGAVLVAVLVLR